MTRLEFIKIEEKKLKEVFTALLNGSEYNITFKNKDDEEKNLLIVKNYRLYFNNNFSLSLSRNDGFAYIGLSYFDVDSKIKFNKEKIDEIDL